MFHDSAAILGMLLAWAASVADSMPVATSCNDLKDTCKSGCGKNAVFPDCKSHRASCTPYSFMPDISDQGCSNWMDGVHSAASNSTFSTKPFFLGTVGELSYQAFQQEGSDDIWVVHGCDGAGIQTDCFGDILYLEHFDGTRPVPPQACPAGTYGIDHLACPTFYHQGLGVSFPGYSCGWWRGYKDAVGIENASSDGVGAFGPAGAGGDYSASMRNALANCPSCDGGSGLEHPYANASAKAYFTGASWPWVCTADSAPSPYTGWSASCYCDNEPWNGRGSGAREYPEHTTIVYCGVFPDEAHAIKLVCDFVRLQDGSKSHARRGVTLLAAAWPQTQLLVEDLPRATRETRSTGGGSVGSRSL